MTRIFLSRTPDDKMLANPRLPYFQLVLPPEQEGGEWITIGALWKAQTGNGYSGKLDDGVTIDTSMMNPRPQPVQNQAQQGVGQPTQPATQQHDAGAAQQFGQPVDQQGQPTQPTNDRYQNYPQESISPDDIPFND